MNNSKKNKIEETIRKELIKQGINPDIINEYGDINFEDGVDEYDYISKINDNYDEYGDSDY